jgi:hypothetical protein
MALHDNRFKGRIGERDANLGAIYDELKEVKVGNAPDTYKAAKTTPPKRLKS